MLTLKNITKEYKTGEYSVKALDNVTLTFRDNEFVSILGQSGSGKTTMLNIIGGLDQYNSGDLIINGVSTKKYKDHDWDYYRNNSIGFVFQSYNLIPHQTVLSNVELALTLSGVSKKERRQRAVEVLTKVGLQDHIHKKPNQLSGGQMQRVAIARALINNPDILLADEPTGALDSETSVQIMDLLKEIAKDKLVIMVTHNPELAQEYSTRIVNLKDGKIINDTRPVEEHEIHLVKEKKKHKLSMSFLTALSLSFNNLKTKKGRTLLTAFAGSIGIIGIALILSLSAGFSEYINDIQEDTLTSYPLTIYEDTADTTSLLLSMISSGNEEYEEGSTTVVEKQFISEMFSSVGKNDLESFITYLDQNKETVDQYVSMTDYMYSVTPQIYSDTKEGVVKLNPSNFFSQIMGSTSTIMSSTQSPIFYEMGEDEGIKEDFKVLAGKWPEKYNEVVLVLAEEHGITDMLVYGLGLRDIDELQDMIADIMQGKEVKNENEPLQFTYDDFLNLDLKLVDASSVYKYNSKYKIYEDMSEDEDYMKNVYNQSEDLKIVGIVSAKDGASALSLTPGIAYTKDLTKHIREEAAKSEIVKKQLANKDINVFSNKSFDDEEKESGLNFEDMISIDEEMLASAFGSDVDQNQIASMTQEYMSKISSSLTTDTTPAYNAFTNTLKSLSQGVLKEYLLLSSSEEFKAEEFDVELFVSDYLTKEEPYDLINALSEYVVPLDTYITIYKPILVTMTQSSMMIPGFNETMIDYIVTTMMSTPEMMGAAQEMAKGMSEAKMQSNVLTNVGTLIQELTEAMASAMNVDPEKIAGAFKFELSEEELSRLMSTMTSSSVDVNANTNLISLGYQEANKPTAISFYFKDFDSKEYFIDFIDEYNNQFEENDERIISYSDITGLLMSSVKDIVDAVTYVLIAFVSISLVVSSIMIGVITYISVLERTKEIGILRAIGASKKDISRVFNAETMIVGLTAGLIGIATTLLLIIPINIVIESLTKIADLAFLPTNAAIALVIISVVLTTIAGLIPSSFASKKDPVEALRSE